MSSNAWCAALKIDVPRLEDVKDHREAIPYSLLLVALLERGAPMTLSAVACRFAEAGIADEHRALQSLKRCKPARPPVYREGDLYHLDPHDDELDLWAFRLGLRPPKAAGPPPPRPEPEPLPGLEVPLTKAELEEAWGGTGLNNWTARRLALAVLEAHGGGPMAPKDIVAYVDELDRSHRLTEEPGQLARRGSPIKVLEDGRWTLAPGLADKPLESARKAVRARLEVVRRNPHLRRPSAAEIEARQQAHEQRTAIKRRELQQLSRALLAAYPPKQPQALALLDIARHEISTFVGPEVGNVAARLAAFDVIGAMNIRSLLDDLGFEDSSKRLAELTPSQKTKSFGGPKRVVKITTEKLIRDTCGIRQPLTKTQRLAKLLDAEKYSQLRQCLEQDVTSLYALYEYGRLHGEVLVLGFSMETTIDAPWAYREEARLHHLKRTAISLEVPLQVVVGAAPDWTEPWSRSETVRVVQGPSRWDTWLEDENGYVVDPVDVQRARLMADVN